MNKTSIKIFICFTLTAAIIATILLVINAVGIAYILGSDASVNIYDYSPVKTLDLVGESLTQTDSGFELTKDIIPDEFWCILIDENGDVVWSENMPEDIPHKYSINDVAKMTHWFLNDYPVYVRTEDYGLLVLGIPKNAVGKYEMAYSMKWFDTLPQRILIILLINICFAAIFAFIFGIRFYRKTRTLMNGINDLQREKQVRLPEKGIFKEISASINRTSDSIERKNAALATRDSARSNWISGISHDIRTPLSVIVGYSEELARTETLTTEERKKAEIITAQGIKIKKLIEDLNLISSLEYDMQPAKRNDVKICPLLRRVVSDVLNSGIEDKCEIELKLQDEKSVISADEALIERAVFNLINNSIAHNENDCKIWISQYEREGTVYIDIHDNGNGVKPVILANISEMPKSAHGLGLPMAYRIIRAHGGKFAAKNDRGLKIRMELPAN
ncbi:MAG: HAMP domain-containing histidine kinase [Oscillospiraceae bacterium]|nr:HAMP domain-containing histidine kinase [Oscillospiraceae bacterium]